MGNEKLLDNDCLCTDIKFESLLGCLVHISTLWGWLQFIMKFSAYISKDV